LSRVRLDPARIACCRAAAPLAVAFALGSAAFVGVRPQARPSVPSDVHVCTVGDPRIAGAALQPYSGTWTVGSVAKDRRLRKGDIIRDGNISEQQLERIEVDGRATWRRTIVRRLARGGAALLTAKVELDLATLAPLRAEVRTADGEPQGFLYDWHDYTIRRLDDEGGPPLLSLDAVMLEAAAHDVWMAALAYAEGFTCRLPVVMASTGATYWVVPRVIDDEEVDLGDGTELDAWVVSLDWWGTDADSAYLPGVGRGPSAGTGGTYWILKRPPPGVGRVFRVRTEIDATTDVIVQWQAGAPRR
jgi:hypothetical protein